MFDKIYRQATDDVPLNTGLLADLKKQAKQLDEQKPADYAKKTVFNIYRWGFVAAALVVAVLGTNIFSSYMATKNSIVEETKNYIEKSAVSSADDSKQESVPEETQPAHRAGKPEDSGSAEDMAEPKKSAAVSDADKQNIINYTAKTETAAEVSEPVKESTEAEDVPAENAKIIAQIDETEPVNEEAVTEESVTADVLRDDTGRTETAVFTVRSDETDSVETAEVYSDETEEVAEETDETAAYAKTASGGGGGGASAAAVAGGMDVTVRETWGIDDYCSYFGIDILGITLPKAMADSRSGSAYVEKNADGTVVGGQCSIYYVADGKSVSLTIYSDSSYVKTVAVGEKLSSGASVVKYENGAFTLYAYPGGRGCVAEIFGFSEEEVTAFANSLN